MIETILKWLGYDSPSEVMKLRDRITELENREKERILREEGNWGENYLNPGPFSCTRFIPGRIGTYSLWRIDAIGKIKHPGIAQVYGKLNAYHIVDCLNNYKEKEPPASEASD